MAKQLYKPPPKKVNTRRLRNRRQQKEERDLKRGQGKKKSDEKKRKKRSNIPESQEQRIGIVLDMEDTMDNEYKDEARSDYFDAESEAKPSSLTEYIVEQAKKEDPSLADLPTDRNEVRKLLREWRGLEP